MDALIKSRVGLSAWLVIYWISIALLPAQQTATDIPRVVGVFLEDSTEIGLPVHYVLTARHSPESTVLFPDSSYRFAPFELIRRHYFNTKTQGEYSMDSVVYELHTFEIEPVQMLSLPVFWVQEKDCTAVRNPQDSLYLKSLVKGNVANSKPQDDMGDNFLRSYFNYPLLIGVFFILVLILLGTWALLGKRITKTYNLFTYRTRHAVFLKEFKRLSENISQKATSSLLEKAIGQWKNHLEYIENKPYSSYTSKEIKEMIPDENLADALKSIDRAIYGKDFSEALHQHLQVLRQFAIQRFNKKQEQLKNV